MNYLNTEDTIIAQCTAEGHGAINIIRISGSSLFQLYQSLTKSKKKPAPNSIFFKHVYINNRKVDEAMVSFFKGPKSFTGEDIIEINCHGGSFVTKKIIRRLCKSPKIRLALPGEFSFRAYYNGKIDVIQAESINELIKSETNVHANKSMENIGGQLSAKIKLIRKEVVNTSSFCEYGLDIDESENQDTILKQIEKKLSHIQKLTNSILSCNLYSKVVEKGFRIALFGRPNVGKSTLFNSILGYDRSIVSSFSGTTRDVVEATLEINGYSVKLIDTAGYRNTKDQVEALGINKTKKEINKADIIIYMGENIKDLESFSKFDLKKRVITVLSKSDINECSGYDLSLSSKNGVGIKELLTELSTKIIDITSDKSINSEYYINDRQQQVLKRLLEKIISLRSQLKSSRSLDIVSELMKDIVNDVDEIVSPIGREEVIDNIFSSFCVGK